MSCPTNEPYVDFSVLRTPKIDENIRNPRIFLRKMATFSCLAGPIDIKIIVCPFVPWLILFKNERSKWMDMIQMIVDALVNKQSQNHIITDEDEKIYRYGYILLCEVALNLVIALVIGIVYSKIKIIMFFLGMYIPLRSFCGGWHADKIWKCTVISNAILLLQVYGLENLLSHLSIRVMLLIFFLNMICIFLMAPVETEMKKISHEEKQIYRRRIKLIFTLHLIIMLIITLGNADEFIFSMMFVYIIQNIMLLLEIVKQKNKKY